MSRVTLDSGFMAKLKNLAEELEFCDEAGETVGRFVPEATYPKMLYSVALAQRPSLAPEEVERRQREPGGRPLSEILNRLTGPRSE